MGYYESYQAQPVRYNLVPNEGRYQIKIDKVMESEPGTSPRYTRIDCVINADGRPHISLFLTEGQNFNGNATAFFDTFGITRGNFDYNSWLGIKGWIDITFKKKDGFTNMVPHYILNEEGYVVRPGNNYGNNGSQQVKAQSQPYKAPESQELPDDIPF